MALRKLERRNYGGKSPVSIKYQNLHSFKEGVILLCQSILETRRISHLHGSALFTIPLMPLRWLVELKLIQLEQQKTQLPLIILEKNVKPILCKVVKGT